MGKWIGYQLFYGFAIGLGFQMAITIAQANAKMEDMSSVTAIVFCKLTLGPLEVCSQLTAWCLVFQTIGGAFSTAAAQSGFVNRMISRLAETAPTINPAMVIGTGATQIRRVFSAEEIPAIIVAYMAGVKITLALTVGFTGVACLVSLLVPWKRLNAAAIQGGGIA
jgi:hypothetical protein